MLERERHRLILRFVQRRSIVGTGELAELLGASEATVRRDIAAMADQGALRRVRGGAEALEQAPHPASAFTAALAVAQPQKRAIARAAAALVQDGQSVLINGGTTTFHLAEFLAGRDLDILTNSYPLATALAGTGPARITIPGGTLYPEPGIVLSPFDDDGTRHVWGALLLTGCHGISGVGIMETDVLMARAQRRLLDRAERVVVMADSSKLRQRSSMIVAGLDRVSALITDDGATEAELDALRRMGVQVTIAAVDHATALA